MKTRSLMFAFLATWCAAFSDTAISQAPAPSASTTPNPVTSHFRAYRTALDRGDLVAAEAAASAALEASVARNGDAGSTGVLAINLAQARLSLRRTEDAYQPALRAFTIATNGGAGVDPLLARLVLGRSELTETRWRQGRDRLAIALGEAQKRPDMNAEVYNAAADLGRWQLANDQFGGAQDSWDIAKKIADTTPGENTYARAESRLSHAAASIAETMFSTASAQARPTDTRLVPNADAAFRNADQELFEAQALIGPSAFAITEGDGLSLGQSIYATILAWRGLIRSFAESRGLRPLADRSPPIEVEQADGRPSCAIQIVAEPRPQFPPSAQSSFTAGAAVVRVRMDENGRVINSRVAAAIPDRWFRESVERVAGQWEIERAPHSAPNCRNQAVQFIVVRFRFR